MFPELFLLQNHDKYNARYPVEAYEDGTPV
jgi:hypothetical protein